MSEEQKEKRAWHILAVTSGKAKKVRDIVNGLAQTNKYQNLIFRAIAITKKEKTPKGTIKETVDPNYNTYIYVEAVLTKEVWGELRNISDARHILGQPKEHEIRQVFELIDEPYGYDYKAGDTVKIIDADLTSLYQKIVVIKEVNNEKEEAVIEVEMFGRPTPMKVPYSKLQKVEKT